MIELVIIVRIVVTHKLPQFEAVNPGVTLWPFFHPETIYAENGKKTGAAFSIAGLSAGIHFFEFRLALSERHRSLVHLKVQRLLESPPCAKMLTRTDRTQCHVISSPHINLHVLMTSSRLIQEHAAKFTEQNAHTRECIN